MAFDLIQTLSQGTVMQTTMQALQRAQSSPSPLIGMGNLTFDDVFGYSLSQVNFQSQAPASDFSPPPPPPPPPAPLCPPPAGSWGAWGALGGVATPASPAWSESKHEHHLHHLHHKHHLHHLHHLQQQ